MQLDSSLKLKWCENRIAVANELCLLVPLGPNEPFEHASPPARKPCYGPWSPWPSPPFFTSAGGSQRSWDQADTDRKGKMFFSTHIYIHIHGYVLLHIPVQTALKWTERMTELSSSPLTHSTLDAQSTYFCLGFSLHWYPPRQIIMYVCIAVEKASRIVLHSPDMSCQGYINMGKAIPWH